MKKIPLNKSIAITLFLVLFFAMLIFTEIYTGYIELKEIGEHFTEVFWRDFNVNLITFAIAFLVFFTLALSNLLMARKNMLAMDSISFGYLKKLLPIILISAAAGGIFAEYSRRLIADAFLPFLTSEWFNLGDPIFHRDVGYYVFQRPFYISIIGVLTSFSLFLIFSTAVAYIAVYARYDFYNMKRLLRQKGIVMHQIAAVAVYFLTKALSYRYEAENILFDKGGEFVGGGYVDINIGIQFYKILPFLIIIVAVAAVILAFNSKYVHALAAMLLYPMSVVVVALVSTVMQTLIVSPDEFSVESAYIQNNIDFTRAAYGLDGIASYGFKAENNLTGQDIMNNIDTINNIRLIDYGQAIKAANRHQAMRGYYNFVNADVIPYSINGKITAVALAAREIAPDKLEESAKNYINMRMRYTHGNGLVMMPVNSITEQGQPYFIIRDTPPRSLEGAPEIQEPRIYFGENMRDYVIAGTKDGELDEAETSGYRYKGSGGIQMTLLNRLVYAFKKGDLRLLISDQINEESKLLTNRIVLERVRMAAPFLTFDNDVYMIIDDDGKLKWIADGYTTSGWFPYSQYSGETNYIRNSVKAVIDAYDGTVRFYVTDENDPVIKSYKRIYPTLFEQDSLPSDIARYIRYPLEIFKTQSEILKKYHVENASDFYEKRGVWSSAKERYEADKSVNVEPYYSVMKTAGGSREEFVLMQPYTPSGKENTEAWLVARCEARNYGQLILYNFESSENVSGMLQVENKIENDPTVSQELSQWLKNGASVIRGNLIAVPVKNSILYAEPLYVAVGSGQLPEIRRIILVYGDRVVSRPTLDEGLRALFGINRPAVVTTNEETLDEIVGRVIQSFDDMKSFLKENDWENYGISIKELDDNIQVLREKSLENQSNESGEEEQPEENSD